MFSGFFVIEIAYISGISLWELTVIEISNDYEWFITERYYVHRDRLYN